MVLLVSFCLFFCRFQPRVIAYKSVAYIKIVYMVGWITEISEASLYKKESFPLRISLMDLTLRIFLMDLWNP